MSNEEDTAKVSTVVAEEAVVAEIRPRTSYVGWSSMTFTFDEKNLPAIPRLMHFLVTQAATRAVGKGKNIELSVVPVEKPKREGFYQQLLLDDAGTFPIQGAFVLIERFPLGTQVTSTLVPECSKLSHPQNKDWFDECSKISVVIVDEMSKGLGDKREFQLKFVKVVEDETLGSIGWEDIYGNVEWKQSCF